MLLVATLNFKKLEYFMKKIYTLNNKKVRIKAKSVIYNLKTYIEITYHILKNQVFNTKKNIYYIFIISMLRLLVIIQLHP